MEFNEYQEKAKTTDLFTAPKSLTEPAFVAKVLGLSGETGEVCEKFKKILRDKNGKISDEDKAEIAKELGDVLWYIATISRYLDIPMEDVAKANLEKLASRKARNELHGSGDNR